MHQKGLCEIRRTQLFRDDPQPSMIPLQASLNCVAASCEAVSCVIQGDHAPRAMTSKRKTQVAVLFCIWLRLYAGGNGDSPGCLALHSVRIVSNRGQDFFNQKRVMSPSVNSPATHGKNESERE